MNHVMNGIVLLALMAIGVSGAYATVTFTTSDNQQGTNTVTVGGSGSGSGSLIANGGSLALMNTVYGPYSFTNSIQNPSGDKVVISADVTDASGTRATGTYAYGSSITPGYVQYGQTMSVTNADLITMDVSATNGNGNDFAEAKTVVAADANRASLYNYWGLGQAGLLPGTPTPTPYAFVGQGFDVAQGDYVDAKTTGSTLLSPSLNAYTEMEVGVNSPYAIMPTVGSYVSYALAVGAGPTSEVASFLPQGWIFGPMGSSGLATASTSAIPPSIAATSVTSTFPVVGSITVTTVPILGYSIPPGGYPTIAYASPTKAFSLLETWNGGTGSQITAAGGFPPTYGPGVWAGVSISPPPAGWGYTW